MSGQAINSIATIIKRLEAATSRLEDVAASHLGGCSTVTVPTTSSTAPGLTPSTSTATPATADRPRSTTVTSVESNSNTAGILSSSSNPSSAVDPPAVTAWDDYLDHSLQEYASLSDQIGGLVAQQATHVVATFKAQRHLVKLAAHSAKPSEGISSPIFAGLLKPLQEELVKVTEIREKNRGEKILFNHLSAVSEGIPAVGWVAVEPKPGPFVSEMKDSAQFYTNRVIKEFKEKDRSHVEWCRSYIKILDVLKEYIMKHHTTGLAWNPKGGDAASYIDPSSSSASSIPAPPPPPSADAAAPAPPPPPPPANVGTASAPATPAGGMGAVFSQLNKGEGVTSGLKKVDPSQMTHKNPSLRATTTADVSPLPSSGGGGKPAPPPAGSKPPAMRPKKPAKTQLEGNKWTVENHEDNKSIIIDATELNHTVNIFNCKNCVVQIKGKINAVAMVSCQKTSLLLDTLVSSLELTSSPSFTVQILGLSPIILLDSCDSGQIYLSSPQAVEKTQLIVSKCSAVNVSIPKKVMLMSREGGKGGGGEVGREEEEEEEEFMEIPLPEQFKFALLPGGVLKSEVVAHSG